MFKRAMTTFNQHSSLRRVSQRTHIVSVCVYVRASIIVSDGVADGE